MRSVSSARQDSDADRPVPAPASPDRPPDHRYVRSGLVPMTGLAGLLGPATPAIDSLVTLAAQDRDSRPEGFPLAGLSLAGLSEKAQRRQATKASEEAMAPHRPPGPRPASAGRPRADATPLEDPRPPR
jgi:hypothetical protein